MATKGSIITPPSFAVKVVGDMVQKTCNYSITWLIAGIILMVNLLLYILIVNWSIRLDKSNCECAKDWRKTFAVWYPPIAVVASLLIFFSGIRSSRVLLSASILIIIGWLVMCFGALTYLRSLVYKGCMCAKRHTIGDEALEVFAAIKIATIMAAALTLGLMSGMGAHVLSVPPSHP